MNALTLSHDSDLGRYLAEVSRYPQLSRDEEHELASRFRRDGDIGAAHALVVSNLRFVVRIANEYKGYGMRLLDLIQEGNVGLMKAVRKYDPGRGYRLITYAVWWIRAQIHSYLLRSWSLVRMASGKVRRQLFYRLRSETSRAEAEAQGDVSAAELADRLGVSEDDITEMQVRMAARDFSLDAPLDEETGTTHVDVLAGPDEAVDVVEQAECSRLLHAAIDEVRPSLADKERRVLDARMLADEPPTFAELGEELGLSRQRVQQIESKVLDRLREAMPRQRLPRRASVVSP